MDLELIKGPKIVYLRALDTCNAKCIMCRFAQKENNYQLPWDQFKSLVKELSVLGTNEIRFTGGEPLLYEHIIKAIYYIRSLGMKASIITNGCLLHEMAEDLLTAGVNKVICSLDSPRPELHNYLKGKENLLEDAVKGLSTIRSICEDKKIYVKIIINTVVSNINYLHINEFIPLFKSIGVKVWNIIPIKDIKKLYLSKSDIYLFNKLIVQVVKDCGPADICLNTINPFIFGTSENQINASSEGHYFAYPRCYVPYVKAYIDAERGEMTACNCFAHRDNKILTVKNIWDKPFDEVWNSDMFREKRKIFVKMSASSCTGCDPSNIRFNSKADVNEPLEIIDIFDWD